MTHQKRQQMPKRWPIQRKGTAFLVRSAFDIERGIPILVFVRDMLGLAQNRREVKIALTKTPK